MTVNSTNITSGPYPGNGVSSTFSYTFRVTDKTQLKVFETDDAGVRTTLVVDTDYTVAGIGDDAGGIITRVAGALPIDYEWYIRSDYKQTQKTAISSQGSFFPDIHENALDKLTFLIQQLEDATGRAVRLSEEIDLDGDFTIDDDAITRASKFLGFDASGNILISAGVTGVPVSAFMATVVDDDDAFEATGTLKSGYVRDTKAKITALPLTSADAGRKVFSTSDDGGAFTIKYNSTPGTYVADGGAYWGTVGIPDGGDGTIGIVRDYSGYINAKWFGVFGIDGTTDETTEAQNALDVALLTHNVCEFTGGNYLITDSLNVHDGSQISGITGFQYNGGFGRNPKATTITFAPTVANTDLFAFSYDTSESTDPGFLFHISIENLYIVGNSNSRYALNLDGVIYSRFSNIGIEDFDVPIACTGTINNRFENIFMKGNTYCAQYFGANETSDVWTQCTYFGSPEGVHFNGSSIGIRFNQCLFEQIDNYGLDIAKECQDITVTDAYSEDVPYLTSASTRAMFRVGTTGSTLVTANHLIVNGGHFTGRSAGETGSTFDIDSSNGVIINGIYAARYTNFIRANKTNCRDHSVILNGASLLSITNAYVDETLTSSTDMLSGVYPNGVINSGSFHHDARFANLLLDTNLQVLGTVTAVNSTQSGYQRISQTGIIQDSWNKVSQRATGITTAATIVTDVTSGLSSDSTAYIKIHGSDSAGNGFFDILVVGKTGGIISTISSTTTDGAPSARTYTLNGFALQLAMAAGTYNVNTMTEISGYPF